ncbi:MAG: HAD hydrolase-like protein [Candidatus Aenigmatarchaeota archaeon]
MPGAVLFDLEGTVAFYEKRPSSVEATKIIRHAGIDVYYQEWEAARRFALFVEAPRCHLNSWKSFVQCIFELLKIKANDEVINKIVDYYKQNTIFSFFDDVSKIEMIPLKKALVTSIPRFFFDYLDLNIFDAVVTGSETGMTKGNPLLLMKALQFLEAEPRLSLMVGNDIDCDILPAKEIGMQTLLMDRDNSSKVNDHKKITTIEEVLRFL